MWWSPEQEFLQVLFGALTADRQDVDMLVLATDIMKRSQNRFFPKRFVMLFTPNSKERPPYGVVEIVVNHLDDEDTPRQEEFAVKIAKGCQVSRSVPDPFGFFAMERDTS